MQQLSLRRGWCPAQSFTMLANAKPMPVHCSDTSKEGTAIYLQHKVSSIIVTACQTNDLILRQIDVCCVDVSSKKQRSDHYGSWRFSKALAITCTSDQVSALK